MHYYVWFLQIGSHIHCRKFSLSKISNYTAALYIDQYAICNIEKAMQLTQQTVLLIKLKSMALPSIVLAIMRMHDIKFYTCMQSYILSKPAFEMDVK